MNQLIGILFNFLLVSFDMLYYIRKRFIVVHFVDLQFLPMSRLDENDFASNYDFCMVLPLKGDELSEKSSSFVQTMSSLGFDIFCYKGSKEDCVFVLIRSPIELLQHYAEKFSFSMLLDPTQIEEACQHGLPNEQIAGFEIAHRPDITEIKPYDYVFGRFSRQVPETLYWRPQGYENPFRESVRYKITPLIIESKNPFCEENIKIFSFINKGYIKAFFPLHRKSYAQHLDRNWIGYPFKKMPLFEIKEYFGEKIALYFAFMDHYTKFLSMPAVIGLPMQVAVYVLKDFNASFLPAFSFFISIWSISMLEYWKRKEKTLALKWGVLGFESHEADRADFQGEAIKSFIDGTEIIYFSTKEYQQNINQSFIAIATLMLIVVGLVASIYIIRTILANEIGINGAQIVASLANAVQIQITNYLYSIVATYLTDRENHRTDTKYEDSMIIKLFLFQFVNSYASFFYIAFVAEHRGDCPPTGCMEMLSLNLAIVFGSRLISGNMMELIFPMVLNKLIYYREVILSKVQMSRPEKEFLLQKYDPLKSGLNDYAEVAIQFGYNSLFVTALPMSSAFAYIATIVEFNGDAWKLLHIFQRPVPHAAEDIGTWQSIFTLLAISAVITNAGLTVFTMTTFSSIDLQYRFWIFIIFQWLCFSLQAVIMAVIPDVPEEIEIQSQRSEVICNKLINRIPDEVVEEYHGSTRLAGVKLHAYPHQVGLDASVSVKNMFAKYADVVPMDETDPI